jgi:enoyl-CoA hydratase
MILTGRGIEAQEALEFGLANRVCERGEALRQAVDLARQLGSAPQGCMRSDRMSAYEQWSLSFDEALANEFRRGLTVVTSGETVEGAGRFASGKGRHGEGS